MVHDERGIEVGVLARNAPFAEDDDALRQIPFDDVDLALGMQRRRRQIGRGRLVGQAAERPIEQRSQSLGRDVADRADDEVLLGEIPSGAPRSAEHTSALQSLMSISYAVFCLNKKNNTLKYIVHIKRSI